MTTAELFETYVKARNELGDVCTDIAGCGDVSRGEIGNLVGRGVELEQRCKRLEAEIRERLAEVKS